MSIYLLECIFDINFTKASIRIMCYSNLDLAHVSIPVDKGLLAGKVADLAVPRSQCGKDPSISRGIPLGKTRVVNKFVNKKK